MATNSRLNSRISQIVKRYADMACNKVQSEWGRYFSDLEGDSVIDNEVSKAKTYVKATIYAYGQRAWILEYGRGSKMDDANTNPYLMDYLKSDMINPARTGKAIVGRPAGTYPGLDFHKGEQNIHNSAGKLAGVNIEGLHHKGEYPYRPLKGQHIISNILFGGSTQLDEIITLSTGKPKNSNGLVQQMLDEIQGVIREELQKALQSFPKQIGMTRR